MEQLAVAPQVAPVVSFSTAGFEYDHALAGVKVLRRVDQQKLTVIARTRRASLTDIASIAR